MSLHVSLGDLPKRKRERERERQEEGERQRGSRKETGREMREKVRRN